MRRVIFIKNDNNAQCLLKNANLFNHRHLRSNFLCVISNS